LTSYEIIVGKFIKKIREIIFTSKLESQPLMEVSKIMITGMCLYDLLIQYHTLNYIVVCDG